MSEPVKNLRNSLNEVLKIDPKAEYEFEDCGSGTNVLNIYFTKKATTTLTIAQLDRLEEEFDVCGDDEGETVETRLIGGHKLFICLS
jgi:hypothetical protein